MICFWLSGDSLLLMIVDPSLMLYDLNGFELIQRTVCRLRWENAELGASFRSPDCRSGAIGACGTTNWPIFSRSSADSSRCPFSSAAPQESLKIGGTFYIRVLLFRLLNRTVYTLTRSVSSGKNVSKPRSALWSSYVLPLRKVGQNVRWVFTWAICTRRAAKL